jgi:hypothetical protein
MADHDHMKNLANLGFIIDEKVRDKITNLNEEQFFQLIETLKRDNAFIVDDKVLKNILASEVRIIKPMKKMEMFTVQDFVKELNEKYSFLQELIAKKLNLSDVVSINKFSTGGVTIIGMVKEKEERTSDLRLCLEDPTGEMDVIISKKLGEKISIDDVLAVTGKATDRVMFVESIMFPDVPLRPVTLNSEEVRIAFSDKETKSDYQVMTGKVKDNIKGKEIALPNPCIFKIGDVTILVMAGSDPLDALKKRYARFGSDDFLINPIPDIVLTDMDINSNYKGITIVSKDRIIDLKTREVRVI